MSIEKRNEPEYLLYCFAQSGNAYKVALLLETVGVQRGQQLWQTRFVDFFNGETRTPEYRAINVMGEVPACTTADLDRAIAVSSRARWSVAGRDLRADLSLASASDCGQRAHA